MINLFGDRLKELRKEKKISQEELGELFGVAKNTISNWENNVNKPDIDLLRKIARFFNVTTDYLLGLNQEEVAQIEKLKVALKEAGVIFGDDLTLEELEKALQIVNMMKGTK